MTFSVRKIMRSLPRNVSKKRLILVIGEMEEVKKGLIQEIELYFKEKEAEVRRETSKYTITEKNLSMLKK